MFKPATIRKRETFSSSVTFSHFKWVCRANNGTVWSFKKEKTKNISQSLPSVTLWRIYGIISRSTSTEQKLSERTYQSGSLKGWVKVHQNKEGTYEYPTRLLCDVHHGLQTWLQPRHGYRGQGIHAMPWQQNNKKKC